MTTSFHSPPVSPDAQVAALGLDWGNTLTPKLAPFLCNFVEAALVRHAGPVSGTEASQAFHVLQTTYWQPDSPLLSLSAVDLVAKALSSTPAITFPDPSSAPAVAEVVVAEVADRLVNEIPIIPDARRLLQWAHAVQLPVGVFSNLLYDTATVCRWLERWNVLRYVDVVLVSSDEGVVKPDPQAFHLLATELQVTDIASLAYVGDRLDSDAQAAAKAGLHGVWLRPSPYKPIQPIFNVSQISRLTDIPALFPGNKLG